MNAVAMVTYNNLELTKDAVESVFAQDIPVKLFVMDNGSTDGTMPWLHGLRALHENLSVFHCHKNVSPVSHGNQMARIIFARGYDRILGVPNDVILPPNLYREMSRWPRGVVTASMTEDKGFPMFEESHAVNECTPMAVAMIRKWAFDALVEKDGYFLDEGYFHYASDCDMALRLAACGIRGIQLDIQYWHHCSASWRLAPAEIGKAMTDQADVDRSYFFKKWGFGVADSAYGEAAGDINFRGERLDR